jgi:hypothetical protein
MDIDMPTKRKKKNGEPEKIEEYGAPGRQDHKIVPVHVVEQGKFLKWAYDCDSRWDRYTVDTGTPRSTMLFNFEMPVGKLGPLLVLDNYGDEGIPDEIRQKILNTKMFRQTIGIFKTTGEIVHVSFIKEKVPRPGCSEEGDPGGTDTVYALTFWRFGWMGNGRRLFVPKDYIKRLDELKSQKRPFRLTVRDTALFDFITRWRGFENMQENIAVILNFSQDRIQIWRDGYFRYSDWMSSDNPHDPEHRK